MRNEPSDIIGCEVVALHDLIGDISHPLHRTLEHGLTFLIDIVFAVLNAFNCRGLERPSSWLVKEVLSLTVHAKNMIDNAIGIVCSVFKQNCTATVTEEHTRCTVFEVEDGAHLITAKDQTTFHCARLNHLCSCNQSIEKTTASAG